MSICDEGWDTHNGNCICWDYEQDYCNLEQEPDNCFYIPILKLLVGATELDGLSATPGLADEEWTKVIFWMRRGRDEHHQM